MRKFSYYTVGYILERLKEDGVYISRKTFSNLENEGLFLSTKTVSGWRRYSQADAELIIKLIKENYGIES